MDRAGIRNVHRGVEIRFPSAEADDVFAFRFELSDAARQGDCRGGRDALDTL